MTILINRALSRWTVREKNISFLYIIPVTKVFLQEGCR